MKRTRNKLWTAEVIKRFEIFMSKVNSEYLTQHVNAPTKFNFKQIEPAYWPRSKS